MNLPEGVKDGRYENNHENDTCVKDRYFTLLDFDGLSFEAETYTYSSLSQFEEKVH